MTLRKEARPREARERVPLRRKAIAWLLILLMAASVLTAVAVTFSDGV